MYLVSRWNLISPYLPSSVYLRLPRVLWSSHGGVVGWTHFCPVWRICCGLVLVLHRSTIARVSPTRIRGCKLLLLCFYGEEEEEEELVCGNWKPWNDWNALNVINDTHWPVPPGHVWSLVATLPANSIERFPTGTLVAEGKYKRQVPKAPWDRISLTWSTTSNS